MDEPAYVGVLIQSSTSAVRSDYPERVAQHLAKQIQAQLGKKFNVAAAGYAVDLARGLGVITEQNTWTALGHLVALFAEPRGKRRHEDPYVISPAERLLYFRVFLEGDGAALAYLARFLLEHETAPNSEDDWNSIARNMFLTIFDEYLRLTTATSDRVSLRREIERIRSKGYKGKSGPHKMFVHLQSMYRVGLIDRVSEGSNRRYTVKNRARLEALVKEVGNALALEETARAARWADVAALTLCGAHSERDVDADSFEKTLTRVYERIMATGIALCPLGTVFDAMQIEGLLEGQLTRRAALEDALTELQKRRPKDVRLHVDRTGRPAFLKL
ncbi:MAG: hypothetical protein ACT4PI_06570 [Actinomycetota bacterium]